MRYADEQQQAVPGEWEWKLSVWISGKSDLPENQVMPSRMIYGAGVIGMALGAGVIGFAVLRPTNRN